MVPGAAGGSSRIRIEKNELAAPLTAGPSASAPAQEAPGVKVIADVGGSSPLPLTMKANRRVAGKVCPVCQGEIRLGEDVRVCEHCKLPYHVTCWEENGGCATYGCEAAVYSSPRHSYADTRVSSEQVSSAMPPAPPYQQGPPAHGYGGLAAPVTRTSGLAIASLVLGLLWLGGLGSLLAIIFGHAALSEINKSQGHVLGRGMAIAGIVLGYLFGAITLLSLVGPCTAAL